jgi:integrase
MCKDYRDDRPVANATARYELLMLSTALNWALDKKHLVRRRSVWLPAKDDYQIRYLEGEDFETFFAAVKAPHARLYVLLGVYTLARPSAILELQWSQVDLGRRLIDLNPPGRRQTAKNRPIVPINDELYEALVAAYAARQGTYVIEHGSEPIQSIKKAFQAASKRSEVKATPYTLRHTGAVWAAEAGLPMSELAQFMGHDDDRTTQKHYARFSPDYLRKAGEKVSEGRRRRRKGSS